jgi:peptidylprolyl isomerase
VKLLWLAIAVCAALAVAGCGDSSSGAGTTETTEKVVEGVKPKVKPPKGPPPEELIVKELAKGHGPKVKPSDEIKVQYVGLRWDGELFQSSWENGKFDPFTFKLDAHQVIRGWEKGIPGMRVGGRRELTIPPKYIGYLEVEPGARLNPENSLLYVVDVLAIE